MVNLPVFSLNRLIYEETVKHINGKRIFLYDLNPSSKKAMHWLLKHDIYVSGFLLEDERRELAGIRYLNKPMYFFEDFSEGDESVIVDADGSHVDELKKRIEMPIYPLFRTVQPVILYGAGDSGQRAHRALAAWDVPVLKFCDGDMGKQGKTVCGLEVLSPDEVKRDYYDIEVVVAINRVSSSKIARDLEEKGIARRCSAFDFVSYDFELHIPFSTSGDVAFHYLIQCVVVKQRKIVVYGHRNEVVPLIKKLALVDVEAQGLTDDGYPLSPEGVRLLSTQEFAQMDASKTMVLVLESSDYSANGILGSLNLPVSSFLFRSRGDEVLTRFNTTLDYDPILGFNFTGSVTEIPIVHLGGAVEQRRMTEGKEVRIGILGDSTTVSYQWWEPSWPEYFGKLLGEKGSSFKLFTGAIGMGTASYSLMKFIRDLSHAELDMLIYYGGASEGNDIEENRFVHSYQKHCYEKLGAMDGKRIEYGKGIADPVDHWIWQVRMMHGIADELGIKFYAILDPALGAQQRLSK